jgi:ribonuclease G
LKRLVQSIKPKGFGVIVRTVAEGKNTAELEKICRTCSADGLQCVKLPTAHHPSKVLGELNRASSIETFSTIPSAVFR